MLDFLLLPQTLVFAAGALFTIGYLIINQVILRLFVLAGSMFYIAYYATVAANPLWEAIIASGVMALANVLGLIGLLLRRSRWSIPAKHRDIYPLFSRIPPGDFREIIRHAKRWTLTEDTFLSREGDPVGQVHFVLSGGLWIEKLGDRFAMGYGVFVGETAYITGNRSAATTIGVAGTELASWNVETIRRVSAKKPRFKLAFEAMISGDLAQKVALAVAPRDHPTASDPAQGDKILGKPQSEVIAELIRVAEEQRKTAPPAPGGG